MNVLCHDMNSSRLNPLNIVTTQGEAATVEFFSRTSVFMNKSIAAPSQYHQNHNKPEK